MSESIQNEFYERVYNNLYQIGYHADPNYSHSYPLIEWLLENVEFESIVDVGASTGAAVKELTDKGKAALGLEVSMEAVELAHKYGRSVIQGMAQKMPFPTNFCDVVMSTDVMEHLAPEHVADAISECHRVARLCIAMKIASFKEMGSWGDMVGVSDLHLTVKPIHWWIEQFLQFGGELIFHQGDVFIINLGG